MSKKLIGSCLLLLSIVFMIVIPSRLVMPGAPAAQAEQTRTRSPGLGYLLLAKSGINIHPAPMSKALSGELKGMISELQTISLPVPAQYVVPPTNYIAIGRHEEVYINAASNFAATQRKYNLADWTASCTGTIVSDSNYGSFLIYVFSSDVGTKSTMTVTDSWVKGLTFNIGSSLLSPGGGQPSGTTQCGTTNSIFVMAVAANLPSGSSWSYSSSSGTFTINVGAMSSSTFYYLEFYYFPKTTNSNTNFFSSKPSLLFAPTTMVAGNQYIVTSGVGPFSVKPPGGSWINWARVATLIAPWLEKGWGDGTNGIWFVGADPYYWSGNWVCSFPGEATPSCNWWKPPVLPGAAEWDYAPYWTGAAPWVGENPMTFSWNHVLYGQLVYNDWTTESDLGGCGWKTQALVGVDSLSVGTDLIATTSSYPDNLPTVVPGTYPPNLRIAMDTAIQVGTLTVSCDGGSCTFTVWNGATSWIDFHARTPTYTTSTPTYC